MKIAIGCDHGGFELKEAVRHNNANILCMGGKVIDKETAVKLVDIFLHTEFEGGRHQRRIDQIAQIEEGTL